MPDRQPDDGEPDDREPDDRQRVDSEPDDRERVDREPDDIVRHRRSIRISAAAVIAVLTALLGFAIVVQVHQNSRTDNLANLREDDLVGILDNQNARAERLRQQIADLQQTLLRLQNSGDRSAAARQQAEQDAESLGILLGTVPAAGPGVAITVTDPVGHLHAADLLDIVEELRGAGAEAIQFGTLRVSTTTAFTDVDDGAVAIDGTSLTAPYTVLAIGDPKTLDTALNIPGGVAAAIRTAGAGVSVAERSSVLITATRSLPVPKYAKPTTH